MRGDQGDPSLASSAKRLQTWIDGEWARMREDFEV